MKKELLIGAGRRREKILFLEGDTSWHNLTTVDINPLLKPDIVWDLCELPLPFDDNSFDEIHAYEVLEHTGSQGDYKFFFNQFSDFWRILKPDGYLFVTCPWYTSKWAWGDPSHTRIIQPENLLFLDQKNYQGEPSAMTDFRYIYTADFQTVYQKRTEDDKFTFVLKSIKPSGIDHIVDK